MERCIFNVYKYSRVESGRQSIKPYAESDKVGSESRFRNQQIKINVRVHVKGTLCNILSDLLPQINVLIHE